MALISGSQTLSTTNLTDLLDGGASTLHSHALADDSIVEAKFDVSNGPSNDYFLQAQSAQGGGLTWAAAGASKIGAHAYRSSGLSTAANTAIDVAMNDESWDTDNMWSSGDPERLTIRTDGLYYIQGSLGMSNGTGYRTLKIMYNNSILSQLRWHADSSDSEAITQITTIANLTVSGSNNFIYLQFYHNNGGGSSSLQLQAYSPYGVSLMAVKIV